MSNSNKKNIVLFLASQTLSLFGSSLVQYAIVWYITIKTQSGIMMTISIVCGFIPMFILSPFAGVWADRYNRKLLIIFSDLLIAVSTLVLAVLFYMGYNMMWLLFAISAVRALGTAIQTPAVSAFIPQITPEDKLTRVNAINGTVQSLVTLVSPMISGALLTFARIEYIFLIDVVTAAVAIAILGLMLNVPAHAKALEKQVASYFDDMRQGMVYIKNHKYIKNFIIFDAIFLFLVAPSAFLTPLQVTRSFGNDVWRLTAIEIAFSAGMTAGGVLIASWGGFKNKLHTMALSNYVIAVFTIALGVIPAFVPYLIFTGIIGLALPIFNTPSMVLFQEKIEEEYLGRIFGVLTMIVSIMMPAGMLFFGPVADFVKIEWIFIATGIALFIQSIFFSGNNALIEAGKPKA